MALTTQVLVEPIVTEKTVAVKGMYAFKVADTATKTSIKAAVKEFYGVDVADVNIINLPEKTRAVGRGRTLRRRRPTKKALVTLKKGQTLEFNAFK